MSTVQRVTLTLPADVLAQARELSQGNLSQFVANVLRDYVEHEQLQQLHDVLVAGYQANAEEALEIAEAFRYAEDDQALTISLGLVATRPPSPSN
jgi:metal-responsive CopG/Arc/MetJ family transcriptional regulator